MTDEVISKIYEKNEINFDGAIYLIKNFCKKINGTYISNNLDDNIKYIIKMLKIEDISYFINEGEYCCSFICNKSKESNDIYTQEYWEQRGHISQKESLVMLISKMLLWKKLY